MEVVVLFFFCIWVLYNFSFVRRYLLVFFNWKGKWLVKYIIFNVFNLVRF